MIHDFFQGVNYDLLVPCPDCIKSGSTDPHLFSTNQVKRATNLKAPFLQCSKLFHIVSLPVLRAALPPSTMAEYEQHLLRVVQDMSDLRSNVTTDVCILCCSENINQPDQMCPRKLMENFQTRKISCSIIELKEDENISGEFGLKLSNTGLMLICVSSEFCKSQKCNDTFTYVGQCNKPILYAIVGKSLDWKTTTIGLQIATDLYFDFQKAERFETKWQELLTRVKARISKSIKPVHRHKVFFSYCWANSVDSTKKGRKKIDSALGTFAVSKKLNVTLTRIDLADILFAPFFYFKVK